MYKCTECGLEFENKPDYCDCGNDEFVSTNLKKDSEPVPEQKNTETEPAKISRTVEAGTYDFNSSQESDYNKFSLIAVIFFILCLILSVYIDFIWNPLKVSPTEIKQEVQKAEVKNIPSINKLWKEGTNRTEIAVKGENGQAQIGTNTLKPVQKVESSKLQTPVVKKNVQNKSVAKPTAKKSTPTQTKKPASNTQKTNTQTKSTSKAQTSIKSQVVDTAAQKAAEDAKKQQEAKQKAEQEAKLAAERAKKTAEQKQEFTRYKINLRNALGQKIDFTKVIGDGDCVITFKLDSSGRLINRAFAKQSSNITLNNAVYNAVMSLPSYYPPPALYNNETLKLNIRFNNGNFAITLE